MPRGGVVCRGIRRTFTSAPWVRSTDRGNVSAATAATAPTAATGTALYEQMELVPGFTFASTSLKLWTLCTAISLTLLLWFTGKPKAPWRDPLLRATPYAACLEVLARAVNGVEREKIGEVRAWAFDAAYPHLHSLSGLSSCDPYFCI